MSKIYYNPCGFVSGSTARLMLDKGQALPLVGGSMAFSAIEELTRDGANRVVGVDDFCEQPGSEKILGPLTGQPPSISGLDMSRPNIMGVLNVTPDSFSDGGEIEGVTAAIARASRMALEGADVWDVGGESTRPGSELVADDEELSRVLPVVKALVKHGALPVSIDSRKPNVFKAACAAGAQIINDVSALTYHTTSRAVAASLCCPVILMHAQGDPKTMQDDPIYENVVLDVYDYFEDQISSCVSAGIDRTQIMIDPGIGFGKTLEHNLMLMRRLSLFHGLGCPLVLGTSRKSFIGKLGVGAAVDKRLGGSIATVMEGANQGVQVFRVHDVQETRQALSVWQALNNDEGQLRL